MRKEELSDFNKKLLIAMNVKETPNMSKPFISMNKLAEFSEAGPVRRRQIIKSFKDDKDYVKLYYQHVKAMLPKFFETDYDTKYLSEAAKAISKKPILGSWKTSDRDNSLAAIELLRDSELPDLDGYRQTDEIEKLDHFMLAGVKVLVRPDIYLVNNETGNVGGIKFHFAKTPKNQLSKNAMEVAATIIKYGLMDMGYSEKQIDNNACISFGVFEQDYAVSPKAYKSTLHTLTACCEEIADRWDSI